MAALAKGKPTVPPQAAYHGLLRAAAQGRLGQAEEARGVLAAGLESLSQVSDAEEPLLAQSLAAIRTVHGELPDDAQALALSAKLLARLGRREAAAAAYAKLARLEPKGGEWRMRLTQLQPGVVAFWNFDFDLETRRPEKSTLTAGGGALRFESVTGMTPSVEWNVAAPAGCKALTLRVRTRAANAGISYWWATAQVTAQATAQLSYPGLFVPIAPGDAWQTITVYFTHDADLARLGVGFNVPAKQTLEIDAAWLRSVDVQTALKELAAAIAEQPKTVILRRCRGALNGSLGQWEQAQADFVEIARQRPGDPLSRFFPMLLAAQTGDRERYLELRREGMQRWATAKSYTQPYELMSRAALLLPAEGDDLKVASESADRAVAGDQGAHRLRWSRLAKGLAEYRGGAFQSATEWLEKSRQLLSQSPSPHQEAQALCVLAMAHERLGDKDKARELLAQASRFIDEKLPKADSGAIGEAWPDWIIAQVLRREAEVVIVGQVKSEEAALAALAQAVERAPTDKTLLARAAKAARLYAELLQGTQRLEAARTHFRQARAWYEKLLALEDNDGHAGDLADVLLKEALLGGPSVTKPSLRLAQQLARDLAYWKSDPRSLLGAAWHLVGDDQAALRALNTPRTAKGGRARFFLALVHHRQGKHDQAREALKDALRQISTAGAEETLQRLALETIDRVSGDSPDEAQVLSARAALLMRLGNREAAAAAYAKLAKLEPDNAEHGLRLAHLRPETIAAWHFDFDAEGWQPLGACELAVRGGVLQIRKTGGTRIRAPVSAPAGCYELAFRLRAKNSGLASFVWTTTAQQATAQSRAGYRQLGFLVQPAGAPWHTVKLCFCASADLTGLAIGFGQTNESLEIDAISLRRVEPQTALTELEEAIRQAPNPAHLRLNRAILQGILGKWEQALTELGEIKRLHAAANWRLFYHLLALAQTRDAKGFVAERRDALARLTKNKQGSLLLVDLTARAALVLPAEEDELKLAADLIDRTLKDQDTARRRWRQLTKGLAEYRGGRFASAIDWLEKSRQGPPETPAEHLEAQALLVLVMAHHRLGQEDRARESLAQAAKLIDDKLRSAASGAIGETWPDWIMTHALRREAADLIAKSTRREPLEAPPAEPVRPKS